MHSRVRVGETETHCIVFCHLAAYFIALGVPSQKCVPSVTVGSISRTLCHSSGNIVGRQDIFRIRFSPDERCHLLCQRQHNLGSACVIRSGVLPHEFRKSVYVGLVTFPIRTVGKVPLVNLHFKADLGV